MRRFIFYILLIIMPIYAGIAGTVSGDIKKAWGYSDSSVSNGTTDDFMIAGGIGENSSTGIWNLYTKTKTNRTASKGIVAIVATKIVAHGGYFCPYQIQCDSKNANKKEDVWFSWYTPEGFTKNNCKWICEAGYAGIDCASNSGARCDTDNFSSLKNGISYKKTDKKDGPKIQTVNAEIPYFWTGKKPEKGIVLGVTKILEHGVIVAPVKIQCAKRDNERAWIDSLSLADGDTRILCAEGYRPVNGDCVQIDEELCKVGIKQWCAGFPADKYDATIHTLDTNGDCVIYTCSDNTKSFTSASNTTCVDCVKDIRNGVDRKTGLCKTCKTGEYFNSDKNDCVAAVAYTKEELIYGAKSRTTKGKTLKEQCWTLSGTEYTDCINGK